MAGTTKSGLSATITPHKRVTGKGSRNEWRPGMWRVRFNLGRNPLTGKYEYSPYRVIENPTPQQLDEFCEEYKYELNHGLVEQPGSAMTVGEYLDLYHAEHARSLRDPSREEQVARKAKELFGHIRLRELTAPMMRAAYAGAAGDPRFTDSEIFLIHRLMRRALKQALGDEAVSKNVAELVKVRTPEYREREPLSAVEVKRFRDELASEGLGAYEAATLVIVETGCRRGEALGLTWADVDLGGRTLKIERQVNAKTNSLAPLKTKTSRRVVGLTKATADWLAAWKAEQGRQLAERGIEQGASTFVAHALGKGEDENGHKTLSAGFINPRNYHRWFCTFCADHGFGEFTEDVAEKKSRGRTVRRGKRYRGITPHDLRHTQGTVLVAEGVDPKTVQLRLGHSSASFTLSQYVHGVDENQRRAADVFGRATGAGGDSPGRS